MELVIHRDKLESSTEREKEGEKEGRSGAERKEMFGRGRKVPRGEKPRQAKWRGENVGGKNIELTRNVDRWRKKHPKRKRKVESCLVRINATEKEEGRLHTQDKCITGQRQRFPDFKKMFKSYIFSHRHGGNIQN